MDGGIFKCENTTRRLVVGGGGGERTRERHRERECIHCPAEDMGTRNAKRREEL